LSSYNLAIGIFLKHDRLETIMNKTVLLAGAAIIAFCSFADPAAAALTASKSRGSEIIGASVLNNKGDTIGKVDDLLIAQDGKLPQAVLSVGGFLGVGSRLIVVPYESFKIHDNKMTFPDATKESLNAMPEFQYAK
jgi:sporulation protein YlmC with PRC-barrel domain